MCIFPPYFDHLCITQCTYSTVPDGSIMIIMIGVSRRAEKHCPHSSVHPFINPPHTSHCSRSSSIRSSVHAFISSYVHQFICSSVHSFVLSSAKQLVRPSIRAFIHQSVISSVYPSVLISVRQPVCLHASALRLYS